MFNFLKGLFKNFFVFDEVVFKNVCGFFCRVVAKFVYVPLKPKGKFSGVIQEESSVMVKGVPVSLIRRKNAFLAQLRFVGLSNIVFKLSYYIAKLKEVIINPIFWIISPIILKPMWVLPVILLRAISRLVQVYVYLALIVYCLSELAVEMVEFPICYVVFIIWKMIKKKS